MIDSETVSRINVAVDRCLEFCQSADNAPTRAVESFCSELRAAGWDQTEVELVKSIANRVLRWD
jgi:hypothetical protein